MMSRPTSCQTLPIGSTILGGRRTTHHRSADIEHSVRVLTIRSRTLISDGFDSSKSPVERVGWA